MKKIMFNDKYGLTKSVLDGYKIQTRRVIKGDSFIARHWNPAFKKPHCYYKDNRGLCQLIRPNNELVMPVYDVGDKVAIAQSYKDAQVKCDETDTSNAGVNNKMFVRADLMPHFIEITNIRLERLQDISDEDCMAEGIMEDVFEDFEFGGSGYESNVAYYYGNRKGCKIFESPREAYADLIDKVGKKGTWESNPFVFVYEFKLVK